MPLCPLQGYRMRINWKSWFETQQSTSFRANKCSEYRAVYGVRWAIHHLLSTSSSCWKSIMAKPVNESWQFDIHIYSAYCIVKGSPKAQFRRKQPLFCFWCEPRKLKLATSFLVEALIASWAVSDNSPIIVHWFALNEVDCCVSNHNFQFILIQ